jgi:hypothetical protein
MVDGEFCGGAPLCAALAGAARGADTAERIVATKITAVERMVFCTVPPREPVEYYVDSAAR